MQVPRRPARAATEPRLGSSAGGRSDGNDLNRERLVFCLTRLVGHRVTAKLRGNVVYEGLFHSCSLDGDYSITLKLARRLSTDSNSRSGEVVQTLVIPGKDYLQVSAMDLPSPWAPAADENSSANKAFATDSEISGRKEHGADRELVPWSGGDGGALTTLEESGEVGHWDQFKENQERYGVQTTYREEIYTTMLDKQAIPQEQRERADRIAREIMSGQMNSEIEGKLEGDDDGREEGRFSDVRGNASGGAADKKKEQKGADAPAAKARAALALPNHEAIPALADGGFARDIRNKRGMISEMKRINALNLEPTLPKPDDGTRNSRMNFTDSQARQPSRLSQGSSDLKAEFEQSLLVIRGQEQNLRQRKQQQAAITQEQHPGQPGHAEGNWQGQQGNNFMMNQRKPDGSPQAGGPGGGGGYPQADQGRTKFSFNPQAGVFTPGGNNAGGGGGGGGGGNNNAAPVAAAQKPAQQSVQFVTLKKNPDLLKKDLGMILEPFFNLARKTPPECGEPDWPDAKGASYHEVLGQPNPTGRPQMVGAVPGAGGGNRGGPVPGPGWQQGPPAPDQTAPPMGTMGPGTVPAPQMMQQGFVVTNAPPGGAPPQMYQQMYAAPGGPNTGPQGPQGTAAVMPPQGGQQQVVFGQQTMMAQQPNQSMAVPVGMGPMPKFGGQQQGQMVVMPIMMAPGQYQPQGFVPQQAVQGQQGPPGPPGPPGQADQQQGQMNSQPMYGHRPSGAG